MKSILDRLLGTDSEAFGEETKEFESKKLQKALKSEDPICIKIKGLDYKRYNYYLKQQLDKEGNYDFEKAPRAKSRMVAECVVEPDLANAALLKHFKCATSADLAEKLFSLEINEIADKIAELSGLITDEKKAQEAVDEVKN